MQSPADYERERKALQASIGRLNAEVWRATGDAASLRAEIAAQTRRLRTIEHLLRWLDTHRDSP
jgi:hypothetical protein